MNVLIACECSGVVREAFRALGHDAWSCDIKPATDSQQFHVASDAIRILRDGIGVPYSGSPYLKKDAPPWHLVIAHPPCTYLCNSGVLRLYKGGKKLNGIDLDRWAKMRDGAYFFDAIFRHYRGPLCVENPVMHGHAFDLLSETTQRTHRQTVQPHQFGDDASKATVLWLRGLPELLPTTHVAPRIVDGKRRWANQTDSGQNKLTPSPTRGAERAVTYKGIAQAMAAQWTEALKR